MYTSYFIISPFLLLATAWTDQVLSSLFFRDNTLQLRMSNVWLKRPGSPASDGPNAKKTKKNKRQSQFQGKQGLNKERLGTILEDDEDGPFQMEEVFSSEKPNMETKKSSVILEESVLNMAETCSENPKGN